LSLKESSLRGIGGRTDRKIGSCLGGPRHLGWGGGAKTEHCHEWSATMELRLRSRDGMTKDGLKTFGGPKRTLAGGPIHGRRSARVGSSSKRGD